MAPWVLPCMVCGEEVQGAISVKGALWYNNMQMGRRE